MLLRSACSAAVCSSTRPRGWGRHASASCLAQYKPRMGDALLFYSMHPNGELACGTLRESVMGAALRSTYGPRVRPLCWALQAPSTSMLCMAGALCGRARSGCASLVCCCCGMQTMVGHHTCRSMRSTICTVVRCVTFSMHVLRRWPQNGCGISRSLVDECQDGVLVIVIDGSDDQSAAQKRERNPTLE